MTPEVKHAKVTWSLEASVGPTDAVGSLGTCDEPSQGPLEKMVSKVKITCSLLTKEEEAINKRGKTDSFLCTPAPKELRSTRLPHGAQALLNPGWDRCFS